jgi:hypothetical protein
MKSHSALGKYKRRNIEDSALRDLEFLRLCDHKESEPPGRFAARNELSVLQAGPNVGRIRGLLPSKDDALSSFCAS